MTDVIVIGGGAAGMMAAGTASKRGLKTILFERNEKVGRKLMITGKGRCNVTNDCESMDELIKNVVSNGKFMYSSFSSFSPRDTMEFFEKRGVKLKVERGNRVFPVSDKASDIVDCLKRFVVDSGVRIINEKIEEIILNQGRVIGVKNSVGKEYCTRNVIVATGGKSYPQTGSTGDGYKFARMCGHTVTTLKPSLVPLEAHEGWCTKAMGLSLKNVELSLEDKSKNKIIFRQFGEMLFTHFGVSGPLVLSASSHIKQMEKNRYILHIDLKSVLTKQQLDKRLQREFSENSNKNYINVLDNLLPRKLVPVIASISGIEFSKKANQITKMERTALVDILKDVVLHVSDFRPIEEAIVTSGGVNVKEIDPRTMQSKKVENLYFCGEVLDVDAYTGGFSLQIAFSSGKTAGESVK